VTAVLDDLGKSFALVQSARSEVTTRVGTQEIAEAKVNQVLNQLAGYVESIAGTNDTLITRAGMETKAAPSNTLCRLYLTNHFCKVGSRIRGTRIFIGERQSLRRILVKIKRFKKLVGVEHSLHRIILIA
jgi:hypothetical protein